jgi:hypothetical protein
MRLHKVEHAYSVVASIAGRVFTKFHLDVGIGDAAVQPTELIEGRNWLDFAGLSICMSRFEKVLPLSRNPSKISTFCTRYFITLLLRQPKRFNRRNDLRELHRADRPAAQSPSAGAFPRRQVRNQAGKITRTASGRRPSVNNEIAQCLF